MLFEEILSGQTESCLEKIEEVKTLVDFVEEGGLCSLEVSISMDRVVPVLEWAGERLEAMMINEVVMPLGELCKESSLAVSLSFSQLLEKADKLLKKIESVRELVTFFQDHHGASTPMPSRESGSTTSYC